MAVEPYFIHTSVNTFNADAYSPTHNQVGYYGWGYCKNIRVSGFFVGIYLETWLNRVQITKNLAQFLISWFLIVIFQPHLPSKMAQSVPENE